MRKLGSASLASRSLKLTLPDPEKQVNFHPGSNEGHNAKQIDRSDESEDKRDRLTARLEGLAFSFPCAF